ncbi:MAG: VCBS repeat-containing protein [Labilithrix sp.]|nr:VCBS repeat-containing protein [Labilithrix sp.]
MAALAVTGLGAAIVVSRRGDDRPPAFAGTCDEAHPCASGTATASAPASSSSMPSRSLVDLPSTNRFTVTAFDEGLPTAGQWRNGFDVADLNGDGELDLVHGPARKTFPLRPVVYLGDGQGHWRAWKEATFPPVGFDYGDVHAADLDGDGVLDLAFAVHLKGVAALRHDGRGHFSSLGRGLDLEVGAPFGSRTLLTTDWGDDGRQAILALSDGPRPPSRSERGSASLGVRLLTMTGPNGPGDAPGEWKLDALATTALERMFGDSLALGDIDGDGKKDLAVGSNTLGETRVLFRRASGAFVPVPLDGLRARSLVRSVALADIDGDSRDDLVVAYANSEGETWFVGVDVFFNHKGTFERREIAREESRNDYSAVAVCNFDGSRAGRSLAVARDDGTISLFAADGHGFLTRDLRVPNTGREGCRGYRVRCVDLNRDGKDEIVASFAGESDGLSDSDACASQGALKVWALGAAR